MTKYLYIFILGSVLIACNRKTEDKVIETAQQCNQDLGVRIEIWNQTGKQNLIETYTEPIDDKYQQSVSGWDADYYPYPKKFDVKVVAINNPKLYDNPTYKLGDWTLSLKMKVKVGQNTDSHYPLNSKIMENIDLLVNEKISDSSFNIDSVTTNIWIKGVSFEDIYNKYQKDGQNINQLIFDISLSNEKNTCNYEYVFQMSNQ